MTSPPVSCIFVVHCIFIVYQIFCNKWKEKNQCIVFFHCTSYWYKENKTNIVAKKWERQEQKTSSHSVAVKIEFISITNCILSWHREEETTSGIYCKRGHQVNQWLGYSPWWLELLHNILVAFLVLADSLIVG